jgi:hypothetical protein
MPSAPRITVFVLPATALLLTNACGGSDVRADELDGSHIDFVDVAAEAGIDVVNVSGDERHWYIPESNGCGAAWLDHDGDGDLDLFVANGSGMTYHDDGARLEVVPLGTSRLYRNDGGLRFADVTEAAGAGRSEWINGVAAADADGDGDTDLYLTCFGDDVYLRNDGGRFVDATAESGLGNELWGTGAAFADVDLDGDLDLFVANYVLFDLDAPPDGGRRAVYEGVEVAWGPEGENQRGFNRGAPDRFFLNEGGGRFREATAAAGLELEQALCSYAAVFTDVNGDRWPDLLIANDLQPCNLFVNRKDGTFAEEAVERGFAFDADGAPTSAMGLMVGDVDDDGDVDVLRSNFDHEPNSLHLNDGRGRFRESAAVHGLAEASLDRLAWGGGFFDADLDGDLDLLVANGHVFPQAEAIGMNPWEQRTQLFEAIPDERRRVLWRDVTEVAGSGLEPLRSSRGVALGDPDDDGDLDALVVDLEDRPRLLENRSERRGRWIGLSLAGRPGNRDAFGALVTVHAGERTWTREAGVSQGLFSTHDPRLVFGLGDVDDVDRIEIRWPSGGRTVLEEDLGLDRYHTFEEPHTR